MAEFIPYETIQEADARSAEWWAAVRGPGWQEGNVTQFLYGRRVRTGDPEADEGLPDGVDAAIVVGRDGDLDSLISLDAEQMTAPEVMPCVPLYPAWEAGVGYGVGDILTYEGRMCCVRQAHSSQADWPPPLVPALFQVWRDNADTLLPWVAGERVEVGWQRSYDGSDYAVIQAHVSQVDYTPLETLGTLWSLVMPPTADWAVGVAYKVGDHVIYLGNEYICLQAHTSIQTWNPVATLNVLWALVT
jgi:hypothetical protein